jgi:hypothetical protein
MHSSASSSPTTNKDHRLVSAHQAVGAAAGNAGRHEPEPGGWNRFARKSGNVELAAECLSAVPACAQHLPAVASRRLAAVACEGAVEGVLGGVAEGSGDRLDRVGGVLEVVGGEVHPPAGEVGERRLADGQY